MHTISFPISIIGSKYWSFLLEPNKDRYGAELVDDPRGEGTACELSGSADDDEALVEGVFGPFASGGKSAIEELEGNTLSFPRKNLEEVVMISENTKTVKDRKQDSREKP